MVEKQFDKTKVVLTKNLYTLKTKLDGYIGQKDYGDRSKDKLYILPKTRVVFFAEVFTFADGERKFSVELDGKSLLETTAISLDKLYEVINEFTKKCNATDLLIDGSYNIFAYSFGKDEYIPYNIEKLDRLEVAVMAVAPLIDDLFLEKENYLLLTFGNIIKTVDSYTIHNLIFLLIKPYVENRFPIMNKTRLDKSRIITLQGFSFIFYHIKSLLHAKEIYKETIKTGYDNMSKMNLLPYIPDNIWYVEENAKNLKTERLRKFIKKKKSIFEKVSEVIKVTIPEPKTPVIPHYYKELFDENSPVVSWRDFTIAMEALDWGEDVLNEKFIQEIDDSIYVATPCLIIPDEPILDLYTSRIVFMGFDGQEIKLVIKSETNTKYETQEELNFKAKINKYLITKYGLESDISYEGVDEYPSQQNFGMEY